MIEKGSACAESLSYVLKSFLPNPNNCFLDDRNSGCQERCRG